MENLENRDKIDIREAIKKATPYRNNLIKILENRHWIDEHIEELRNKYVDKWIVVWDREIQAVAGSPEEGLNDCRKKIIEEEAIVMMVPGYIPRPI